MTRKQVTSRERRQARIRSRINGTEERPRLTVFKSNRYVYAQLINDEIGNTIASVRDTESKSKTLKERAKEAGNILAKKAKDKGVSKVVFDRNGFSYRGIIKELADGAREGGLVF